jgi:heat shock protein HslJ
VKNIAIALFLILNISVASAADNSIALEGTQWAEERTTGNIVINFETDNKMSAGSGCVRFAGTYIQDGNSLIIGPITRLVSLARNICVELKVNVNRLVSSLKAIRSAEIEGQKLVLRDGKSKVLLSLRRSNEK